MKKWLRRTLMALALVALTFGVLYETATHVGRGWLRGEAFFEGRPTSYWALRCDEWLDRFESLEEAAKWWPPGVGTPIGFPFMPGVPDWCPVRPRPVTPWSRVGDHFRTKQQLMQDDYWPPAVLLGFPGSEPVLEELSHDSRYRVVAKFPLRVVRAGGAVRMHPP